MAISNSPFNNFTLIDKSIIDAIHFIRKNLKKRPYNSSIHSFIIAKENTHIKIIDVNTKLDYLEKKWSYYE